MLSIIHILYITIVEIIKSIYRTVFGTQLKDVNGKVVLITGTARGIGRELALQFSKLGSIVLCVDINTTGNEETLKLLSSEKCRAYTCDIADYDSVISLNDSVKRDIGHVDILVNNAGILPALSLREGTPDVCQKIVYINILSHLWMTRVFLKDMISRKCGHIVAISSCFGLISSEKMILYIATKHAIVGMMKSLYQELQHEEANIKLTTVCPYGVNTEHVVQNLASLKPMISFLAPDYVAKEIIKGIREEKTLFTIQRWWWVLLYINSFLPWEMQRLIMVYALGDNVPTITEEVYKNFKETYLLD